MDGAAHYREMHLSDLLTVSSNNKTETSATCWSDSKFVSRWRGCVSRPWIVSWSHCTVWGNGIIRMAWHVQIPCFHRFMEICIISLLPADPGAQLFIDNTVSMVYLSSIACYCSLTWVTIQLGVYIALIAMTIRALHSAGLSMLPILIILMQEFPHDNSNDVGESLRTEHDGMMKWAGGGRKSWQGRIVYANSLCSKAGILCIVRMYYQMTYTVHENVIILVVTAGDHLMWHLPKRWMLEWPNDPNTTEDSFKAQKSF